MPLDGSPRGRGRPSPVSRATHRPGGQCRRRGRLALRLTVEFSPVRAGSRHRAADTLTSGTAASAAAVRRARPGTGAAGRRPVPWLIAWRVFAAYTADLGVPVPALDPTSWDLGIFTEYVKQFAHLHAPDRRHQGRRLQPARGPLPPDRRPHRAVLPGVPHPGHPAGGAGAAGRGVGDPGQPGRGDQLGTGAGRAIGAAYGFSWGLQQLVNYDFHEIAFAVPLLACSACPRWSAGERGPRCCWALPLVFVKEDQGFTVAAIGLIIALVYRRQAAGLILAAWGLAWSFLAITVIIPALQPDRSVPVLERRRRPQPGRRSLLGRRAWSASSPPEAWTKLPTLGMILLPTAFVALRSPLVLADRCRAWCCASSRPTVLLLGHELALQRDRDADRVHRRDRRAGQDRRRGPRTEPERGQEVMSARLAVSPGARLATGHGAAMMLAIAAGLGLPVPAEQPVEPADLQLDRHVAAARAAMARVPNGAKVATDLDLLAPLAARTDTFWLGNSAQPRHQVRGVRHREHGLAAAAAQRARVCGGPEPRGAVPPDLRQRWRVRIHQGRRGGPGSRRLACTIRAPAPDRGAGRAVGRSGRRPPWRESCRRSPRRPPPRAARCGAWLPAA